ncbi:GGDEF domain-containing protein [Mesorhizobium sp. SP-1A]|uniref:GGDEF domain-containing protein n=1 Tax=Mesorhizobium sp. SP-1A TaxID=3077840 RepID=UPI0028F70352|nr:GGDEF domain-containing protein [Mesorhizobium sp. SP-1A]
MSGASFILAINLFMAGLLASAFMIIAAHDVRRISARWLGFAYLLGMVYFVIEFSIPAFDDARLPVVAAFASFLAATLVYNAGLAHKYDVARPWWPMLLLLLAASVVVFFAQDLPRQSLARMMAYQLPYAAMQLVGAGIIWSTRQRLDRLDRMLMGVLVASAAQFASKPFLAHMLGGWGAEPQAYVQTVYAMASQSLGTVFGMTVALLTLVILVRDVMSDATSRSEIDALSGLLNRGGFQRRGEATLHDATRLRIPVSLVLADLDHFKLINDNFGHAAGDHVIETFAGFLRDAAARSHVAGRIGGEEFAILLPGANLAAARLFAEGARSAFGAMSIRGLPSDHRCTASFGVAELQLQEGFAELMRRADEALYSAKKGGRDQVRAAGPYGLAISGTGVTRFNGRG